MYAWAQTFSAPAPPADKKPKRLKSLHQPKHTETNMADEQKQEQPKKRSKLKIIILLIILLLLITGGIVCYWWLNLRVPEGINEENQTAQSTAVRTEETKSSQNGSETKTAEAVSSKTVLNIVSIPTVTINLADKDTIRYLKVGFDVELSTKDSAQALEEQKARIRDSIIILLSSKTYADIASTEGKLKVKNEIATRLNQILGVPRVVQIYFNEFVIN